MQVAVALIVGSVSGIYIFTPVMDYLIEETRIGREKQVRRFDSFALLPLPFASLHTFTSVAAGAHIVCTIYSSRDVPKSCGADTRSYFPDSTKNYTFDDYQGKR